MTDLASEFDEIVVDECIGTGRAADIWVTRDRGPGVERMRKVGDAMAELLNGYTGNGWQVASRERVIPPEHGTLHYLWTFRCLRQ